MSKKGVATLSCTWRMAMPVGSAVGVSGFFDSVARLAIGMCCGSHDYSTSELATGTFDTNTTKLTEKLSVLCPSGLDI